MTFMMLAKIIFAIMIIVEFIVKVEKSSKDTSIVLLAYEAIKVFLLIWMIGNRSFF